MMSAVNRVSDNVQQLKTTHPSTQGGDRTVRVHERVVLVNALHILHDTCKQSQQLGHSMIANRSLPNGEYRST